MKIPRFALAASMLLVAVTALPRPALPQGRGERIARVVADCDSRVDQFQQMFRRALQHSGYRGTMRQADLDRHADELSRAMSRVRESWNRERNPQRTRRFVEQAIGVSRGINRVMNQNRFYPELERRWSTVRGELNHLAEAFDLPTLRWD